MVSTRKQRESNRRLFSQLDDFDRAMFIGNAVSNGQENVVVNEDTVDQEFTAINFGSYLAANENLVNVKTLERCFDEWIDREMGNFVDTVEDRIKNAILNAIDSIITPEIELAIRSINASSERDATSVMANSEHGEHMGITAPFENVSERNDTLHVLNTNDETPNNIPDEVSELSFQEHILTGNHTLITATP